MTDDSGIHTFNSNSIDENDKNKNLKKSIRKLPAAPKKATVVKISSAEVRKTSRALPTCPENSGPVSMTGRLSNFFRSVKFSK